MNLEKYKAIIFDLDGVIVSTDECHYEAWKMLADEEEIYFDREINQRLRGVSRMESLEIVLERAQKEYSNEEKIEMATRKNNYYVEKIKNQGKEIEISGYGVLVIEKGVDEESLFEVVRSIKVKGRVMCNKNVKEHYGLK